MAEETPSDNAPNDATGEPVDETTDTPAGKAAAHPAEAAFSSLEDSVLADRRAPRARGGSELAAKAEPPDSR